MKEIYILLFYVCRCFIDCTILDGSKTGNVIITKSELMNYANGSSDFHMKWILKGKNIQIRFDGNQFPSCLNLTLSDSRNQKTFFLDDFVSPTPHVFHGDTWIVLHGNLSGISSDFLLKIIYDPYCGKCGYTFTLKDDGSSSIQSPRYPNSYGVMCNCVWNILVDDSDTIIKVQFSEFNLESESTSSNACGDYVIIYDGSSVRNSKQLGKFCGKNIPGNVQSTGNIIAIVFKSNAESSGDAGGFSMILTSEKNDQLAGLQSVAAILGAISFGIFIGLLICSVLYKRWSNDGTEHEEEHDPANDYDEVIQQAAPPSYRKVMDEPNLYPTTPAESPDAPRQNAQNSFRLPSTDPPEYPGEEIQLEEINLEVFPPLPRYNVVSESEDEWVAIKKARVANKVVKSTLIGCDGKPPSYDAVTSEGSENEVVRRPMRSRNPGRRQSRSQRTSSSSIYQARFNPSDSDTDDEVDETVRPKPRKSCSRLSVISSSESETFEPEASATTPNSDLHKTKNNDHILDRSERSSIVRTRSGNDLMRHALHNSLGKSGFTLGNPSSSNDNGADS